MIALWLWLNWAGVPLLAAEMPVASATALAPRPFPFTPEVALGMGGERITDVADEAILASLAASLHLKDKQAQPWGFEAGVALLLEAGREQARFEEERRDVLSLIDAFLYWQPFAFAKLSAGAFQQLLWQEPFLLGDQTFPGARLELRGELSQKVELYLQSQVAIPTSTSLASLRTEKEKLPKVYINRICLEAAPTERWRAGASALSFLYTDLPATVAFRSAMRGNTVGPGASAQTAAFAHEFFGYGLQGDTEFQLTPPFTLLARGRFLENTKAPTASNRAFAASGGARYQWSEATAISLMVENFFNESDTSPAYYNSPFYGNNNRKGWALFLGAELLKWGQRIDLAFASADLINASAYQSQQKTIALHWEVWREIL